MNSRFCFVFGCSRSGTTALTRLLHSHNAVVIGMERYKFLLKSALQPRARRPLSRPLNRLEWWIRRHRPPSEGCVETQPQVALADFTPSLFEADRFLDFRDGDTNITPEGNRFRSHYSKAHHRLQHDTVQYIGDKVRADEKIMSAIVAQFPSPSFIFIYRDLLRVANSFCLRAKNPKDENWPETDTHQTALANWTLPSSSRTNQWKPATRSPTHLPMERATCRAAPLAACSG